MPLIVLEKAELAFGHVPLLDRADLSVEAGERIALIGRNGAGKSSLLRILNGTGMLDDGRVIKETGLKMAVVDQEPRFVENDTAYAAVASGLGEEHALLDEYEVLLMQETHDDASFARMAELEPLLAESGAWDMKRRIDMALEKLHIDPKALVGAASGGMKKRIALARALVGEPQLLILDEPTNHLDIESIAWLEDLLVTHKGAVLFVTHDRAFLDRVATRVVELDRGRLLSYPGNFSAYQTRKSEQLEVERVVNAKFDKFLKEEEVWIRKGIQARRTRNEGRVRRLESLRRERAARSERSGRVNLAVDDSSRSGKVVAEMTDVSKSFGSRVIVNDLTLRILRGDKIGLVGPNGAGKSTLIKLILGDLEPDAGDVKRGTKLEVAYFDQFRAKLDDEATLADTISPGSDWVEIGERKTHVMTYLTDFLFPPERAKAKVSSLSGGERNRLLLARLFARPANLLVLDEPTNDLDIDTLELLETLLQDYTGTVILVSHDRAFLDNVVTQVLVHTPDASNAGKWTENPGGYSEWQAVLKRRFQQGRKAESVAGQGSSNGKGGKPPAPTVSAHIPVERRAKMSFKEARELDTLPARMAALEAEQKALEQKLADPATYARADAVSVAEAAKIKERFEAIEGELLEALERWDALEKKRA
jgi:ABC transport system ATP-binding/permease protein